MKRRIVLFLCCIAALSSCTGAIRVRATGVSLDKKSLDLTLDESYVLTATVMPENASDRRVNWSSDNSATASVDQNGKVTATAYGSAIISAITVDGNIPDICTVRVNPPAPEAVDLGLSVKWASSNIGDASTTGFYAWGETEVYYKDGYAQAAKAVWKMNYSDGYAWSVYKFCNGKFNTLTKYNTSEKYGVVDNKKILEAGDDVAHVKLGGKWRIPTIEEFRELERDCTWTWTTNGSIPGYKITGKKAGYTDKWIFLPASGFRYNKEFPYYDNNESYYCTSSLNTLNSSTIYSFFLTSSCVGMANTQRCYGMLVRPVTD